MVSLVKAERDLGKLDDCCLLLGVSQAEGIDEGSGSGESGFVTKPSGSVG
jgi:hypothetical protein